MTSGRIGSAVGGGHSRVVPGTASRLLESAMQVNQGMNYVSDAQHQNVLQQLVALFMILRRGFIVINNIRTESSDFTWRSNWTSNTCKGG